MEDINGVTIRVGDKVKTQQQEGGIFNPAPPSVGIVETCIDAFGRDAFQIRFREKNRTFDQFILLTGKINEVVYE